MRVRRFGVVLIVIIIVLTVAPFMVSVTCLSCFHFLLPRVWVCYRLVGLSDTIRVANILVTVLVRSRTIVLLALAAGKEKKRTLGEVRTGVLWRSRLSIMPYYNTGGFVFISLIVLNYNLLCRIHRMVVLVGGSVCAYS